MKSKTVFLMATLSLMGLLWGANMHAEQPQKTENQTQEVTRVISVVNRFFQVLETRDQDLARQILMPGGAIFRRLVKGKTNDKSAGVSDDVSVTGFEALIESLPKTKAKYKETMSRPMVSLHKGVAMLWTDYKFFVDGKLSHTGKDGFSLIKKDGKWLITSITYTVEPVSSKQRTENSEQ